MPDKDILAAAVEIAAKVHHGQVDKGGTPYILHPLHVMQTVDISGLGPEEITLTRAAAVLHDAVEDASDPPRTYALIKLRCGEPVIKLVMVLTNNFDKDYDQYLDRVKEDRLAVRIKRADLDHNLDQTRIPSGYRDSRVSKRYMTALDRLSVVPS